MVTWGHAGTGGDSSAVRDQLQNVQQIQATGSAFAAIRGDGCCGDLGAMLAQVVTAALCEISCRMCSRYKQLALPLLRSLGMAPW